MKAFKKPLLFFLVVLFSCSFSDVFATHNRAGEITYEQISQMLGAPLGTVKWRVSEARRVLKKKLAALGYAYE